MKTALPFRQPPGLCASDRIPSESSPTYVAFVGAPEDSGVPQAPPGPTDAEWSLMFSLVDQYGNYLIFPIILCLTYKTLRDTMLKGVKNPQTCNAILNYEFHLKDGKGRIIPPDAWGPFTMRCMEKRKSGRVIRIVVSPPFFTPVVDDTPLRVVLPVNSCCPIEGMRGNILHALYWLRRDTDTNTIGAVEQDRYWLEDQQGAIVSAPPTPPPTPAPPRASSPDRHPPPPFVTTTEIPVIIVDQESLLRIGGYGSGRVSIVTVAKAASEYLGRGHFVWKEEAKTLLDRAKKAARDCINGMDDTNRGSYRPGTMRQLQLVINLLEQVEYRGLRGKLLTFTSPRNGSDYYTISILSEKPVNNLPIIDYRIPQGEWHQGSGLLKFHVGEDGKMASEDDGEFISEDDLRE